MLSKNMKLFSILVLLCTVGVGCARTKVTRVDIDEMIDLSGDWNDYDAMEVSKEMVGDSLDRPWLINYIKENGKNPIVIVGHVHNRTHEHVNSSVFVKYLERELLNSGKVIFVASSLEREQLRAERADQQDGYTLEETIKKHGREKGADFLMMGSIDSVIDEVKGKSVVFYQVNLELVNLESNEKVWIGQKQIKKVVKKSRFSI